MSETNAKLPAISAMIVAAYVQHNNVAQRELARLIGDVHDALSNLGIETPKKRTEQVSYPAVPIFKSVTYDWLICLEDGKRFKSLKPHLRVKFGMSPDQYRKRWGLPADYPMVAPAHAEKRSAIAKRIGLGNRRRRTA